MTAKSSSKDQEKKEFSREDQDKLKEQIRHHESSGEPKLKAYRCPEGHVTVGDGHNCDARPLKIKVKNSDGTETERDIEVGDTITLEQANTLLEEDLNDVVGEVEGDKELSWVTNLNSARQAVIYDMAFNMGIGKPPSKSPSGKSDPGRGLKSFPKALGAAKDGDFNTAAAEMKNSRWYEQVGQRAIRLCNQMKTGQWQDLTKTPTLIEDPEPAKVAPKPAK